MAKNKKSASKAAKKVKKAKPVARAKKAIAAKSRKAASKKVKPVAKKIKAKKPVHKAAPKAAVKKVTGKKPAVKALKKTAPALKKLIPSTRKSSHQTSQTAASQQAPNAARIAAAAQLNFFPMPNQRPMAHKPAKPSSMSQDKTRYSDEELKEFQVLINRKLEKAREEYKILKETLNRNNDEGTDATSGGNTKVLEDGAETAEKENLSQLAARQQKYITNL